MSGPDGGAAKLLRGVLREYWKSVCLHEGTHRGGAIWTICDACGAKWADDQGGFKPFVAPQAIVDAEEFLSAKARPEPLPSIEGKDSPIPKLSLLHLACIKEAKRGDDGRYRVSARHPGARGLASRGIIFSSSHAARHPGTLGMLTALGERLRENMNATRAQQAQPEGGK